MSMKSIRFSACSVLALVSLSVSASAATLSLDSVVRDSSGNFLTHSYPEALEACESRGMRLPTAPELIRAFNPSGLRKSQALGEEPVTFLDTQAREWINYVAEGFTPIEALAVPGSYSEFRKSGLYHYFWSSTAPSLRPDIQRYIFKGDGSLHEAPITYWGIDHGMWKGKQNKPRGGLALCVTR